MFAFMLAPLLAFTGCGLFLSAEDNWEGTCIANGQAAEGVLDISDDQGGDLKGDLTLTFSGQTLFMQGDGTRDGTDIDMDFMLTVSGYSVPTTFKGEMDGDDLTGVWRLTQSGYTSSAECDFSRD